MVTPATSTSGTLAVWRYTNRSNGRSIATVRTLGGIRQKSAARSVYRPGYSTVMKSGRNHRVNPGTAGEPSTLSKTIWAVISRLAQTRSCFAALGAIRRPYSGLSQRSCRSSSPQISPRAAMIAQDFFRVRVLASGSIAAAYVVASTCPHAEKRPARGAAAQLVSGANVADGTYLIEMQ